MQNYRTIQLLHISDLHFGPEGRREQIDAKALHGGPVEDQMRDDLAKRFIADFKAQVLEQRSEEQWPKAILVTGDLVTGGGGQTPADKKASFNAARRFLEKLAEALNLVTSRIFVVPGNHDVDWSSGLQQPERFRGYFEATSEFSTPNFAGAKPKPLLTSLERLAEGIDIELLSMISPTFSGLPEKHGQEAIRRMLDTFDLSDEMRQQVVAALKITSKSLDIAAIGAHQRRAIKSYNILGPEERPIRIALQHHHLLPDTNIELTQFESVLDAGRVIEELINHRFDLVLTGHKHNRRLVTYRHKDQVLDIYSAPSLFEGEGDLGFTLIEVFGAKAPFYAQLNHYNRACQVRSDPDLLVREGRVESKLSALCAKLKTQDQNEFAIPVLESLSQGLSWSREDRFSNAGPFFDQARATLMGDFEDLARQNLTFRPPYWQKVWRPVIELADHEGTGPIRVVSNNDIGFWLDTDVPNSEASKYNAPFLGFSGQLLRLLIIQRSQLSSDQLSDRIEQVIKKMIEDKFEVYLVLDNRVPQGVQVDFGILGELATHVFDGMGDNARGLKISFNPDKLAKACQDWEILVELRSWSSENRDQLSFADWRSNILHAKET